MPSFASKSNYVPQNHRQQHFASKHPQQYHGHNHHSQHHRERRRRRRDLRPKLSQPLIPDQLVQELRQPLSLLHRSRSIFYILEGTTGTICRVKLSTKTTCYCPDRYDLCPLPLPCKHIKFVFMQVLGVSIDDVCFKRRYLSRSHVRRLLRMPTLHESLASFTLTLKFQELYFEHARDGVRKVIEIKKDDATCPVCLEEIGKEEQVLACVECNNYIHEECFVKWRRESLGRVSQVTCVFCRASWVVRDTEIIHEYINLSGYT